MPNSGPKTIVIFGASGDLTKRKLIPGLYQLARKGRLPEQTRIVGFSRTPFSSEDWREKLAKSTAEFVKEDFDPTIWNQFAANVFYHPGDIGNTEDFLTLGKFLDDLEQGDGATPIEATRVYYLSTAPAFYEPAIRHLRAADLCCEDRGPRRVVIEKPFGTDLASAEALNEAVHASFDESQIYRIDHYLGKETVQNLLVFRFANLIFEPLWNRHYIDHIQITAAEEVAVGDRGGYYEKAGVLRDMFQNHLLQLLMFTAMEAPLAFEADKVRDEKLKVLEAVRPMSAEDIARDTIRAQYREYRQEPGVDAASQTATFAALKLHIDNWRWQGVPFYLRSGKAMSCRTTQLVIQFREPPHMMFADAPKGTHEGNRLVIQIQPAEGIQLHFQTKVPDAGMKLQMTDLDFRFQQQYKRAIPEAYEILLLDTLQGDASLFARSDEVEMAWRIIDPILDAWQNNSEPELYLYEPADWGPVESTNWMRQQGRQWFDLCPVLH